jgi:hypothetical protein
MMKRISQIRIENIIAIFWIPLVIIQTIKLQNDYIITSIFMEEIIFSIIYLFIKNGRKQFKEIAPKIDDKIKNTINSIVSIPERMKKETIVKAKSIYHKRNASKSLSYSIINQNS